MEWLEQLTQGESPIGLLTIGATVGAIGGGLLTWFKNPDARRLKRERDEARDERDRLSDEVETLGSKLTNLDRLQVALDGQEDELWRLHAVDMPNELASRLRSGKPKIVTVMNLKGGVGKTTTVANLAVHFAKQGLRVLAIDLDYQGSLSRMMMLAANHRQPDTPLATEFLKKTSDPPALQRQVAELGFSSKASPKINVDLVACGQPFDKAENRLMLRWLIGDETDDVRYRLGRVLTSDPFASAYDLVLIDAPPRMSTGAINALATSQVVIVPTVLDRLSAEVIGNFTSRLNRLRDMNPALEYVGAVGTLRGQLGGADVSQGARDIAERGLAKWGGHSYLFDSDIKYFTDLAREAGSDIGYLRHQDVRDAYGLLADEFKKQLRL
ncbi:MAG: AAA family ATPase [Pseudomonadota bacterium]